MSQQTDCNVYVMIRSNWIKLLSARAYVIHRKHSFVYKYSSMMTSSSPLARYSQNLFSKIGRAKETSLLRPFSKASYLKTSTGVFRKVFMVGGDGFTAKYSFKHGDYQLTKDDDCAHTIMRLQCIFDILCMMTTRKILVLHEPQASAISREQKEREKYFSYCTRQLCDNQFIVTIRNVRSLIGSFRRRKPID